MDKTYDLARLWDRMWARRRRIGVIVVAATLVTAVVALLLPPWYRAQASLLPPGQEESGFGIATLIRGLAVPGVKVPTEATPADVFVAILQSRRVAQEMVQRFGLKRVYHKRLTEDAIAELRRHSRFKLTESGTIELSVEDHDRRRAAEMANVYVELLDRFNRDVRMTRGRRTRVFLQQRLTETRQELAAAEQRLTDYQAKNKTVAISPEMSSAVENAARLAAQRMALEVRLGIIHGYTRGPSDEKQQVMGQLAELDRQLQALPTTGIELVRLLRDAKTQEQLFGLLTAQFEEARLAEARDVVTVEVLDSAIPPERRVRPRRSIMVVGAFLLSLAAGTAWAAFQEEEPRQAGVHRDPTV